MRSACFGTPHKNSKLGDERYMYENMIETMNPIKQYKLPLLKS